MSGILATHVHVTRLTGRVSNPRSETSLSTTFGSHLGSGVDDDCSIYALQLHSDPAVSRKPEAETLEMRTSKSQFISLLEGSVTVRLSL